MAGWNRSFVISGNTHTANRSGTAGSQAPLDSNVDYLVYLGASSDHFVVCNNVGQVSNNTSNSVIEAIANLSTVNGSVYGNLGYKASLTEVTQSSYFNGNIITQEQVQAGQFFGNGANITYLNLDSNTTGTLAVARLGTGGTYPANSGASITALNASNISSGTIGNSYVNWASPGAIGGTSASTGKFTTLNATTTSSGLRVGIDSATTISEGHIAAFGVSGGSGLIIGWNKGSAATPVVESGATAYVNYSGAGTGGHQFFNFTGTISNWTSTTPQLLGGWASDGAIYTVRSGATKFNWHLHGYTVTAPAATGYISVYIDGVLYKLLAAA